MPRSPEEREVALECLRLAAQNPNLAPNAIPDEAERYYAFVIGEHWSDLERRVQKLEAATRREG